MNELLQKHGCANVFSVPEGLKELMCDITREVLREQPQKIFEFIANYLSVLIITREHGVLAVKILDDLCDCKPSVSEHLVDIGMEKDVAEMLAKLITEQIEKLQPSEGREKVNEMFILKKLMSRVVLDETTAARVCQVVRNAYRDYWYRKKFMEKEFKVQPEEPWEVAAERTIALYKKTKPSFSELTRAVEKIQAAYRGYYVRKNLLRHLKPRKAKKGPKVDLLGPPIDIAESRQIDLGPVINIKVTEDNVAGKLEKQTARDLGLDYDPTRTFAHIAEDEAFLDAESRCTRAKCRIPALPSAFMHVLGNLGLTVYVIETPACQPRAGQHGRATAATLHSEVLTVMRQTGVPSTYHKISFAQTAPMVISIADEPEIIEDVQVMADDGAAEAASDVPEDISDNLTDVASAPSTVPDTPNTTDVEEDGVDTTGDEDGL